MDNGRINPWDRASEERHQDHSWGDVERKLSHYNELLKYIIEYDHSAIAVLDRDLRYLYVSRRFLTDYNVTIDDILGRKHYEIFPGLPDRWKEAHSRALTGEIIKSEEDSFINNDGRTEWVSWECRPWFESNGSIGGIILYTEVITRFKETEFELIKAREKAETSEKSLQDILHKLNVAQHIARIGSWDWNIVTGKMWWSDELYNIFEVDPAEYVPSTETNNEFIHPDDQDAFYAEIRRCIETREILDYQVRLVTGTSIKHCRSMARVNYDEKGNAVNMSGTFMDITEQVQIHDELNAAKEKAEESNRLKTAFLQNISHEVRTPLNSIVGFAELLSDPAQSIQKRNSFSKIISANSQNLIRIISDVIEISQIQSKQVTTVMSKFDVVSSLYKIADSFREITQLKEVDFIINQKITAEESTIESDKGKIEKIFYHLLDNAVKFTGKGYVRAELTMKDNVLEFTVSDTGIGIDPAKQEIIFDPFRQLETGLNRSYGGTGLGLTIVKAFTESLNGNLSLNSQVNNGTTVSVRIPVSAEQPAPGLKKDDFSFRNKQTDDDSVNTILIAEDEYSNFKYLYEVLHSDRIQILHANNGKEAVDICKNDEDIKLILMDLKMPVMDGTLAARQIREFRPYIPIIAQTAYIPEHARVSAVFDDLIAKPIGRQDLMQLVSRYINVPDLAANSQH